MAPNWEPYLFYPNTPQVHPHPTGSHETNLYGINYHIKNPMEVRPTLACRP